MVEAETGSWVTWDTIVPEFKYQRNAPFFNLIVPTVDTARIKYILKADAEAGFHALIGGNSGVGKTVIIKVPQTDYIDMCFIRNEKWKPVLGLKCPCLGISQDYLDNAGEQFVSATKSFSAQTSARALLGFFEEKLEKLRKNLLGPPSGKVIAEVKQFICRVHCVLIFVVQVFLFFIDDLNMPMTEVLHQRHNELTPQHYWFQ